MTDVARRYAALVAAGELRPDPDQAAAVDVLEELADELAETKNRGSLIWRLAGRMKERAVADTLRSRLAEDARYRLESKGADLPERFDWRLTTQKKSPDDADAPPPEAPEKKKTAAAAKKEGDAK